MNTDHFCSFMCTIFNVHALLGCVAPFSFRFRFTRFQYFFVLPVTFVFLGHKTTNMHNMRDTDVSYLCLPSSLHFQHETHASRQNITYM